MDVLLSLLIASFVGTMIWMIQSSIRPITQKVFSQTWHYYTCLIPVFFLLGGTEIVNRMISFVHSFLPNTGINPASGSVAEQSVLFFPGAHTTASSPSFMKSLFDSLLQFEYIKELVLIAMIIWIAGITVFLTVNVKNYWGFKRSILQKSQVCHIAQDSVKVIVSPQATTPMVMGFLKSVVVLPDTRFGEKELAMILSHELIHLKRRDLLVKLLVLLANAMHWFNPVAYSLNKQTNIYCELSCDEKVVQEMDTESRRFYGETLLSMLEYGVMRRNVMGTSSFYHPKEDLKRRLGNLMSVKKTKKSMVLLSLVASITLVGSGAIAANIAGSGVSSASSNELLEGERNVTPDYILERGRNVTPNYIMERGRNITVINAIDGSHIISFDKNGNVLPAPPSYTPKELTADEIAERIRLHIEGGLAVPGGYITDLKSKGKTDLLSTLFDGMSKITIFTEDGIVSYDKDDLLNP